MKTTLGPFRALLTMLLAGVLSYPSPGMLRLQAQSGPPPAAAEVTLLNQYDASGNVTQRMTGNGQVIQYGYDALDRLLSIDYPDGASPDAAFAYDANGNLIRMEDWTGTTAFTYDVFDRLTGIDYPGGGFVRYGYDPVGNVTDLQFGDTDSLDEPGGYNHVRYTYDADNHLLSVTDVLADETTRYEYDPGGNPTTRTLPNGVLTRYGYDDGGRLTSVEHTRANGQLIVRYTYTLNSVGQRLRAVETTPEEIRTTTYTYDVMDRLDTVTYPDGRFVDYDYDAMGNRIRMLERVGNQTNTRTYTCDADSRLLAIALNGQPEESLRYDATGNLIQRIRAANGQVINYVYDAENRLVRYADGTNTAEYVYNAAGLRVAKNVNGDATVYVNDPNRKYVQVLAQARIAHNDRRVNIWGNELAAQKEADGDTVFYPLYEICGGNVTRVLDSSGTVIHMNALDAFGSNFRSAGPFEQEYGFHGEVHDQETGLIFMRARYLNPHDGRFITRDRLSGIASARHASHPYTYADGDPVNKNDPSGDATTGVGVSGTVSLWGYGGTAGLQWSWGNVTWRPDTWMPRFTGYFGHGPTVGFTAGVGFNLTATDARSTEQLLGAGWEAGFSGGEGLGGGLEGVGGAGYTGFNATVGISGGLPAEGHAFFTKTRDLGHDLWNLGDAALRRIRGIRELNPFHATTAFAAEIPGGIALDKSASLLPGITPLSSAAYDVASGSLVLMNAVGGTNSVPVDLDSFAVAVRAVSQGAYPVVSIEEPMFEGTPEWGRQAVFTVRYGPYFTDPTDGQSKVLDVASKTRFGWVMFEADRLMKCLSLGADNRDSTRRISSAVSGYRNLLDLGWQYRDVLPDQVTTRFWFNPKEIVIAPSPDGRSMELRRAAMQLSTETMFASNGQVESTPDAEYFATWFTQNYDAIAHEQVTHDDDGNAHKVFQELQQLAALVGIVKWIQENNIPMDLSFLENYEPRYFASAPDYTPVIKATFKHTTPSWERTITITGGVNYCHDLDFGLGGDPGALATAALAARSAETNLTWQFQQGGTAYQASAVSIARQEKDGSLALSVVDAEFQTPGETPLRLERHFDSFNLRQGPFGWGWQPQPYALEFLAPPSRFNLCGQEWDGYGEAYFVDRAAQAYYRFAPAGLYDREQDPLGIANRFAAGQDILVYDFQSKEVPGLLFSDNRTHLTLRLAGGTLLDFGRRGELRQIEDRNGNRIRYEYDAAGRLLRVLESESRAIRLTYDARTSRVSQANLPDDSVVTYAYDAAGHLNAVHQRPPGGVQVLYAYTADHQLTEVRDETGQSSGRAEYDVYGRVSQTLPAGSPAPFQQQFSLRNRTTQITGPEGFSRSIAYDAAYHPTQVTDAAGRQTSLEYNPLEEVTRTDRPDGARTEYFYDARGQRLGVLHPNGRADLSFFDARGNPVVSFHAEADAAFRRSFDAQHRLLEFQGDAYVAGYTEYAYDTRGNLVTVTDANDHARSFGYDARGQVVWVADARGQRTQLEYDAVGRLVRVADPLGRWLEYTYDARDNLTAVRTIHGRVDQAWDLRDQLTGVTTGDPDRRRTTTYRYDARGQLVAAVSPDGAVTEYSYDPRGNLVRVVHDGLERFHYDYDGLDRLTATHYAGTAGGEVPSLVPFPTTTGETGSGPLELRWLTRGTWDAGAQLRLQYALDGGAWTDVAALNPAAGRFTFDPAGLAGDSLQLRYLVPAPAGGLLPVLGPTLDLRSGTDYYLNDGSVTGDVYCRRSGRSLQPGQVTGRSPDDPVDSLATLLDHYALEPGDRVWVDTGTYSTATDLWIGAEHSGAPDRPVLISGPTGGGEAVFTHSQPAGSFGVLVLAETSHVTVQHLTLRRGGAGLLLWNATNCVLRALDCATNGVPGEPGELGFGAGIWVRGGRGHRIEENACHDNQGVGGDGSSAAMHGGDGAAYGILLESPDNVLVRSNHCYANSAQGGRAGSATAQPGFAEAAGILVRTIGEDGSARALRLLSNSCRENRALGRDATESGPSIANGGDASVFGIGVRDATQCVVSANTLDENLAWGGRSWNGSRGASGGNGFAYGLYVSDCSAIELSANRATANVGKGEYGGNGVSDQIGLGWAAGLYVERTSGAIIRNLFAYRNRGMAYASFGREPGGVAYSSGIELDRSPDCRVLGNTLMGNNTLIENQDTGESLSIAAQIYVWGNSTNCQLHNNILDAGGTAAPALSVEPDSRPEFVSDYNLFHLGPDAAAGIWESHFQSNLEAWRAASGQDSHSLAADPQYDAGGPEPYRLSMHSPAVDAGIELPDLTLDLDGEHRPVAGRPADATPRPDIGCDEFVDQDGDQLADVVEIGRSGTDPRRNDTDGDGLGDGWELTHDLDPLDPHGVHGAAGDPDGDGYTNREESEQHTDPRDATERPNFAPQITQFSPANDLLFLLEGDQVGFRVVAEDRDGDAVSYAWHLDGQVVSQAPQWTMVTDDESSGPDTLAWSYPVDLEVSDGRRVTRRSWLVEVRNRNRAPVLEPLPDAAVEVGELVRLAPVWHDPDNANGVLGDDNDLTLIISGWMEELTRTTTELDRGIQKVHLTVRDDGNPPLSTTRTIRISVGLPALRILAVRRLETGAIELKVPSDLAGSWRVLGSIDLVAWSEVPHARVGEPEATLIVPSEQAQAPYRFFRLVFVAGP